MAMQPPPSRWRVIEKGRRLIVIDTRAGDVPVPASPRADQHPMEGPALSTLHADRRTLVTRRWWDAKGPRTIQLDYGGARSLDQARGALAVGAAILLLLAFFFPLFLVVLPIALLQPRTRDRIRGGIAGWLDGLGQTVSSAG